MPRRQRFAPVPQGSPESTVPFDDAETAWFWFVRCQRLRAEGARIESHALGIRRPCEPDDLYRAVIRLRDRGRLGDAHLRVLARYGLREAAPDPRAPDEASAARLWGEALDSLDAALRDKGIVAPPA